MQPWPRVVVVGPGGVGSYFGGMLARAGAPVKLLGRPGRRGPHLEAIERVGLRLDTVGFDERVAVKTSVNPKAVADADLVLFCVKTVDTDAAAGQIAPHLPDRAIVVDMQNGVDNPVRLRRAGIDPIPAVVYVAAAVETLGEVKHRGRGDLVIGHPTRKADLERVAAVFERAGIACVISDDVEREMWVKLILNSMANAISALTDATYGRVAEFEPTWQIAENVAREAVEVARAEGHELKLNAVIRRGLDTCRSVAAATASTQQDLARGRPTEIDALNGYIASRGAQLGVATPVNRVLWGLVKLRERGGA